MATRTTLLLLDVQNGIVDQLQLPESFFQGMTTALTAARNHGLNIVHIVTAFRDGYPESSPTNSFIPSVAARGLFKEGDPSVKVHASVTPISKEPVITKRRVSAFCGTELDMILRCANNNHIVIAGLISSGAVLSTVQQAADLDYGVTILRDLCMDRDEEVHRVLMDKVFFRKHSVVNAELWVRQLEIKASND
ncbi:hypothetical protein N7507_002088 [Penicillium longicatenatum]|nr:hypothetical protein N7507_002088 [Penicillium longicatenatum]